MSDISKELEKALRVCSNLSRDAKAEGDLPTMYRVNEAWHALFKASEDLRKRRNAVTRPHQF